MGDFIRILIFSDAWHPQVNGVVRTLQMTERELKKMGHEVCIIHPYLFRIRLPFPIHKELCFTFTRRKTVEKMVQAFKPDVVHLATEGNLGLYGRAYCIRHKMPFTSAIHTFFPEYFEAHLGVPPAVMYAVGRWIHKYSSRILVPTPTVKRRLEEQGFKNLVMWGRGVDLDIFKPLESPEQKIFKTKEPVLLFVGRVSLEKNVISFLNLKHKGKKIVVGEGAQLEEYKKKFPEVDFVGIKTGPELVSYFASADVFVFPSLTDTFGLVLLEALACGTPVAAYPVTGPVDVITDPEVGILHEDLDIAVERALRLSREKCRAFALNHSWKKATEQFVQQL